MHVMFEALDIACSQVARKSFRKTISTHGNKPQLNTNSLEELCCDAIVEELEQVLAQSGQLDEFVKIIGKSIDESVYSKLVQGSSRTQGKRELDID